MLENKIDKETFCKYLQLLKNNDKIIMETYNLTNGNLDLNNFEEMLAKPYRIIEKLFFTEEELDIINWYLYEDVDKIIYNTDGTIFKKIDSDDDLWDYLNNK